MLRIHCLPRNMRPITCALLLLVLAIHQNDGVEVHFEASDSGFFLKHSRQPPVTPDIQLSSIQASPLPPTKTKTPYDSILSIDRFTVVQTTQPVSIRASYGPFSTKQTVPARYIVPDALDNQGDFANNTTAALLELQQTNMHLDISAHLVRSAVSQDSPVLRVLFHTGADPRGHSQRQKICVLLHVSMGNQLPLKGRCIPEGEDGVCVAEVVIPSSWWPLLPPPHRENNSEIPFKAPQRYVQVSYSVFEPPQRNPEQCEPKVQIQPLTTFTQVPLINAVQPPKELRADDTISILLPQYPLYPMSKLHVPVFLNQSSEQLVVAFTMKARVKSGIRIIGATLSNDLWNISIEKENSKHTTARVTAFRKDPNSNLDSSKEIDYKTANGSIFEVFSWLLEVGDDTKETLDGGKIVWSVTYVYNNAKDKDSSSENFTPEDKKRLIAKLEINKDDIQAVLPMAKNWELMNTAVLTGRQVAQAMKVFIVSQAGKIADVTLQSSCHAEDESVIKVSSSCSSVYVDGSEIRGSSNASIIVKYGTYVGLAKFTVWMPEFPLEVYIADFRLSQIKGWKVLDENHFMHKQSQLRRKRSFSWGHQATGYYNNVAGDKLVCRARYQQSPVEVYARFLAIDQNSGRISYFISRRTGLRVTDLVQPLLRVADPKIACLKGRILQGKSMGRTDVQVLSPITGRVIGAKEIRVGSDKVALAKLIVRVVSGLQLTITPDSTIENGYIAETSVTHKLTAQYQEGLLDIDLEFTDGSRTPLRDISVEDYFLLVESLDTEVVAFAPMLASHHPRVIAVGEGNGNLLRITLLLSEDCRTRRNVIASKQVKANVTPLATALASVEVDFNNVESASKMEAIQNDGISGRERKMFRNSGDLTDIIVGIPLRDDSNQYGPTIHARPHRGSIISMDNVHGKRGVRSDMTSMEIGMYVLLTAFCFAIIVFVISCVVYASKFRPMAMDGGGDPLETLKGNFNTNILLREQRVLKEPTTNAHDWVWLGRSTMDRSSVVTNLDSTNFVPPKDQGMRITSNPISNYANNPASSPPKKISSFYKSENRVVLQPETEPIDAETPSDEPVYPVGHPIEYRPPVPPHRNIGVRASVSSTNTPSVNNNAIEPQKTAIGHLYEYQNHRRNKSVGLSSALTKPPIHEDINNLPPLTKPTVGAIGGAQCYENAALHKNVNRRSLNSSVADSKEMHNAEKLVENSICHKKNVFQFDSLTPKKSAVPLKNEEVLKGDDKLTAATLEEATPDEEKVELVLPNPQRGLKKNGVKRATVVGNPMFSTNEDDDGASEEILGLDDLDMDYEQIMDYFDNLKESNA